MPERQKLPGFDELLATLKPEIQTTIGSDTRSHYDLLKKQYPDANSGHILLLMAKLAAGNMSGRGVYVRRMNEFLMAKYKLQDTLPNLSNIARLVLGKPGSHSIVAGMKFLRMIEMEFDLPEYFLMRPFEESRRVSFPSRNNPPLKWPKNSRTPY